MLIGISDAVTVLARSSTSRMKPDPNNIDIGMEVSWLTPAVRRAMWGMTSPTQETVPDTLTQQEVMRVATTIRTGRNSLTFTPSEAASLENSSIQSHPIVRVFLHMLTVGLEAPLSVE
jgi:hypothetical protein